MDNVADGASEPVKSVGPICRACEKTIHESCAGCRGCGCLLSAVAEAKRGPKLPDPATYKGAP